MSLTQVTTGGVDENINIDSNTLKVDGTNNRVGIGVSAPFGKLQVKAGTDANFLHTTAASEASLEIINDAGSANAPLNVRASEYKVKVGSDEKLRIDSSGRVLIGATAAANATTFLTVQNGSGDAQVTLNSGPTSESVINMGDTGDFNIGAIRYNQTDNAFRFFTSNAERMRVDGSGRVLIGTSTEGEHTADDLTIATSGDTGISIRSGTSNSGRLFFSDGTSSADEYRGFVSYAHSVDAMLFGTDATERMRLDSSGRLGVKNSSPSSQYFNDLVIGDGSGDHGITLHTSTTGSSAIAFSDATSGSGRYAGYLQYDHSSNSMRFYTNGGNEQMRILSTGDVTVGKTTNSLGGDGIMLGSGGLLTSTRSYGYTSIFNRGGNDGQVIVIAQGQVHEGSINVSGTTVSYNGGHLSRWSQLAGGAERTEILRGSVLSNLDEMCEWGEEDNEQLNRMKVSDVEGDVNVSGVFQDWDDDDDTYTNDFFCAMTGDFVIRIAQGATVARGDLLMSAGDGTAKPQDDDIVRSKTIAKVTSTTVSTTYSDGSYCVPCVLMAC